MTGSRHCEACKRRWPINWAGTFAGNSRCPRCGNATKITPKAPDQSALEAGEAYVERLCREADTLRAELGFPLPEEVGAELGRRDARRLRYRRERARAQGLAVENADLERLLAS